MAINRSNLWVVVAVVFAAVVAENGRMCMGTIDMGETKDAMMEKAEEAKESAGSWADWAKNKFTGSRKWSADSQAMKEGASDMMNKAGNAASGASSYASDKAHQASGAVSGSVKGTASAGGDVYVGAKNKVGQAYESAKETASPVSDKVKAGYESAKETAAPVTDTAKAGYDGAKDKASNAYTSTKETAKAGYETAKEKASDAAGNVGAKMRNAAGQ